MFSNDLNSAYEYERERRNDERRAAAESQLARGLGKSRLPIPMVVTGIMVVGVPVLIGTILK